MYYQNYDDYMRSALGFEQQPMMSLNNPTYQQMYDDYNMQDLNEFYPEIYRIVYPIVCRECSMCTSRSFSNATIDEMVDRVYDQVEESNCDMPELRSYADSKISEKRTTSTKQDTRQIEDAERETRVPRRNPLLRDLIRILLLRELIRNRRPWGWGRPNFPGGPGGRPPMPPGGMRPPMMPRYY